MSAIEPSGRKTYFNALCGTRSLPFQSAGAQFSTASTLPARMETSKVNPGAPEAGAARPGALPQLPQERDGLLHPFLAGQVDGRLDPEELTREREAEPLPPGQGQAGLESLEQGLALGRKHIVRAPQDRD